jgi:hypothetical protein
MWLMYSLYRMNIEVVSWSGPVWEGGSEENWKRWTNWDCNTHMHGGNTRKLPVYLSLSQTNKTSCFSFYLCVFSSTKLENRRVEQALWGHWCGGEWGRRENTVKIWIPIATVLEIGGEGVKDSSKGAELKYDIFDTL